MNDLISKTDLIERCNYVIEHGIANADGTHSMSAEALLEFFRELSPAQSQRMHGKWIRHEYADIVDGYYVPKFECDQCHAWKNDDSTFCPECGADMRGDENESND